MLDSTSLDSGIWPDSVHNLFRSKKFPSIHYEKQEQIGTRTA